VKHNGHIIAPLRPSLAREPATGTSPTSASHAGEAGLHSLKVIPGPIAGFDARWPLELDRWPGLEAQVAALADDIAYVNHDIDDGLRAGIFKIADLTGAPLAGAHVRAVTARYGELELSRFIGEMIRTLMSALLDDVRAETQSRLAATSPRSAADVRGAGRALVSFSAAMQDEVRALKDFLYTHMYRHPRVLASMERAKAVVTDLFEGFNADPSLLPPDWAAACAGGERGRVVRDYIAGMTDTYALSEYTRVFHTEITL
jgi:dGTPase